jgi:hypothetical protein
MNENELLQLVKDRLIEALQLANIENIPINKIIFAYVNLKRLEMEMSNADKDEQHTIFVRYVDELAHKGSTDVLHS